MELTQFVLFAWYTKLMSNWCCQQFPLRSTIWIYWFLCLCNISNKECMINRCSSCTGTNQLKRFIINLLLNPSMHNAVKWPNILCGVHTARFLKYVWPFYNIMHERVKWYNDDDGSICYIQWENTDHCYLIQHELDFNKDFTDEFNTSVFWCLIITLLNTIPFSSSHAKRTFNQEKGFYF